MTTTEHTHDVADALIWLGIVAATVWAFGNAIGWISSSMRVDMIPISGGVATVAGIRILVGKVLQKPDVVISDAGGDGKAR